MKKNIKKGLLDSIGKVYEQSNKCKLETSFFKKIEKDLLTISEYFNTTKNQSFIIANVFALNYKGDTVDLNDLIEYFECNPMKLLVYSDDFKHLYSVGIFTKKQSRHRIALSLTNDQFIINDKISDAILNNSPMPIIEQESIKTTIDVFNKIYDLVDDRENEIISSRELFRLTKEVINENQHFPLIKKIKSLNYSTEDTYIYIYIMWRTIIGSQTINMSTTVRSIFDKRTKRITFMQEILAKENILIKDNLIEIEDANFFSETEAKLSETSILMLEEFDIKLFNLNKKKKNVIAPDSITKKILYFNESEGKHLELLQNVLEVETLQETQKRLTNKGLPKGITCLLHGGPGTGKTESVYQIAKATNREIVKVEISESKSMWFGESEKKIKQIFTDYASYAKECKIMPILLFNEADAIISKRTENTSSNVAQTENAIQNILLEELENFEGIFFATTNLAKNLDSAFERRFLFKIEFQKPEISVKAQIWKSKLPTLSDQECLTLASEFNFSGGVIDNIVRKNEIQEIIHGVAVDFKTIVEFCKTELIENKRSVIGFKNSN